MRTRGLCALGAMLLAACGIATAPPPASAPPAAPPAPAPKVAAAPKPPATPPSKAVPAPPPPAAARPVAAARLDLKSLEQRLKDTHAIGVMTKLSLKNQVDDLLAKFKAFHAGSRPPTLTELRPSFDLLLMKVLSLLQDKDKALAAEINASREAIWGVLSDRQKFAPYQ